MCGINIIINTTGRELKEPLEAMQLATLFRGPNASQKFVWHPVHETRLPAALLRAAP